MNERQEQELLNRARAELDAEAESLEPAVRARLRAARRAAIESRGADGVPHVARRPSWLWPAGMALSAGLTAAVVVGWLWFAAPPGVPASGFDDLDLLATQEGPEFYDNIDFYRWIAEQRRVG